MQVIRLARGLTANAWKWCAGSLSAAAAVVSIVSYAQSHAAASGAAERSGERADAAIRWLGIAPAADTVHAIGDTIHLAATATDARGNAVTGAATVWSSADTSVIEIDDAGTAVARSAGATTVVVSAGGRAAQARIVVRQRPAVVRIVGDGARTVPEGERFRMLADVVDARGYEIARAPLTWRSADAAIAAIDSVGEVVAGAPGQTTITAASSEWSASVAVTVVPVPQSITVVAGEAQRAPASRTLPAPIAAQVVSRGGRPIEGVPVRFVTGDGAGRAEPQVDTTDARGVASATWTLGPTPGRQRLGIAVGGVETAPAVVAEADPVAANARVVVVSESLAAPAGEALASLAVIRVTDSTGAVLADVPVSWTAANGGAIVAESPRTDSLGEARARWTLGPKAGSQRARVQVGNPRSLPAVTMTATAKAGAPVTVTVAGGGGQDGTAGKALKRSIVLRVTDRDGNRVPGASLVVAAKDGGAADSAFTTDAAGEARVSWTLGRGAGTQHLAARLAEAKQAIEIVARARSLAASNLTFVAPPSVGLARKPFAKPISVEVADAYGNPVPDQLVVFAVRSGSVKPSRVMTDARGRASVRWTLGSTVAEQSLSAAVKGTDARATLSVQVRKR